MPATTRPTTPLTTPDRTGGLRSVLLATGSLAVLGAATLAYSILAEPKLFTLRRIDLPVLDAGFIWNDDTYLTGNRTLDGIEG